MSRKLDFAATGHAGGRQSPHSTLGDDDGGGRLAAQFLQFPHRALDCLLRGAGKLLCRVVERPGVDLETDRQRAGVGQNLGFAGVDDFPARVRRPVALYRRQRANGPDLAVGKDFLAV
ncbi:hypothetical protein D3C83_62930 [compost metagenome]